MMIPRSMNESTVEVTFPFKSRGSDDDNFSSKVIDMYLSLLNSILITSAYSEKWSKTKCKSGFFKRDGTLLSPAKKLEEFLICREDV